MNLHGLACINIELTSRCNKTCWMCGRRKVEREYPELALEYGDMDFVLVEKLARQLPPRIVVQFHKDGEALLYSRFGAAAQLFSNQITNIVTNGKLLLEKADEVIDNLDTLSISVVEDDPEADEQFDVIREFLRRKGKRKPFTTLRFVGNVDTTRYGEFDLLAIPRVLHSPMGSFAYRERPPTIPEIGICLDFLHHLVISRQGLASICVRFDPKGLGVIGDVTKQSLDEIWNGPQRGEWLEYHKQGRRDKIPLCSYCEFWGVPTSPQ